MKHLCTALVIGVLSLFTMPAFAQMPQLSGAVTCTNHDNGQPIALQCYESRRVCHYAFLNIRNGDAFTKTRAENPPYCSRSLSTAYQDAKQRGFKLVEARLPSRYGFDRDERGRVYQTYFDLRSRWWLGVAGTLDPGWLDDRSFSTGARLETGVVIEDYDEYDRRRNRHRFLVGSVLIDPLEVDASLWQYSRGRNEEVPSVWVTTFIGEPKRFDIDIHLGPGVELGRFNYYAIEGDHHALTDIVHGVLNWEMLQSSTMETLVALRVGGGVGIRWEQASETPYFYYYPEVALDWHWVIDDRGLTELRLGASGRIADEPATSGLWKQVKAGMSFERVVLAINDQPISLYVEPHVRWTDMGPAGTEQTDLRMHAGARVSLFSPPRMPDDLCPNEAEDLDGFNDHDGCLDEDNDEDGVLDRDDWCPNVAGTREKNGC